MKICLENLIDRLGEWFPVFIITPHDRTVGNTAEEIYYALLYARRKNKKLIIARRFSYGVFPLSNENIFELESPFIIRGPAGFVQWMTCAAISLIYDPLPILFAYIRKNTESLIRYFLARAICLVKRVQWTGGFNYFPLSSRATSNYQPEIGHNLLYNPRRRKTFDITDSAQVDWKAEFSKPIPVHVARSRRAECDRLRLEMGIADGAWHVCWHVREGGYYGDTDAPRNSDIRNSVAGMQAIVDAGGFVVRMGDASMTPLPAIPGVIDYPFTKYKSALMDLFLIDTCHFYVGSNSGILDVAHLFQKRCLLINATEWTIGFPTRPGCLALLKHIYSRDEARFLSIEEILQQSFRVQDLHRYGADSLFIENTPEEIRAGVLEMLEGNRENTALQNEFIEAHHRQLISFMQEPLLWEPEWVDVRQKFRISARCLGNQGTLGRDFLEHNWAEDSLNRSYSRAELLDLNGRVQTTARNQV